MCAYALVGLCISKYVWVSVCIDMDGCEDGNTITEERRKNHIYIHAQHCTYSIKMSVFEKALSKNWWIPGKANPEFNVGICVLFTIFNPLHDKNVYFAQIPQPCIFGWAYLNYVLNALKRIIRYDLFCWSDGQVFFFCLHCWIEHSKTIHVNDSTNWNQNIWLSDGH